MVKTEATNGQTAPESADQPKHENRLRFEQSPYLLQHQHNPVDWYAWGDEAFEKARRENKPIFLSIGYSTCHWCHVMERESFEDEEVAAAMNEAFVSIKVDKEERPDIDNIYMTACQVMGRRGGWPLTILMTPDKKPFFAATYIPKDGMLQLTQNVKEKWAADHATILEGADQLADHLRQLAQVTAGSALGVEAMESAFNQLAGRFDATYGGFGVAPKFPTPHNLLFLLRQWKRSGNDRALAMVETTLQAMRRGGVYDHVGFGFHRYSTDQRWFLPHFEKMLYDQALLAMAYTEAYQATGKAAYADTVREIFTYVMRDMTAPEGGFYSAEDADSEGEEGKFYLWAEAEMRQVLTADEADLMIKVFNTESGGNYREEAGGHRPGTNHLHMTQEWPQVAQGLGISEAELRERVNRARQKLFDVREKRVHPYKDDKVLTDWNGLMIAALAKGAQALGDSAYTQAAQKAADFVLAKLVDDEGRLIHRYRQGDAGIRANVDDYAFMVWGLLELYEASFEVKYLESAIALNDRLLKNFWDDAQGGFFFTPNDGEELLIRQKEIYDGAIPAGNSVALLNLMRLGRITFNREYEAKAAAIGQAFSTQVSNRESGHTLLMSGLDFMVGPGFEVVIAGDPEAQDTQAMVAALRKVYLPNKVVLLRPNTADGEFPRISQLAEFTENQTSIAGKATAYVCQNYTCSAPTTDIAKMVELLGSPP